MELTEAIMNPEVAATPSAAGSSAPAAPQPGLSVVVPVYRGADTIGTLVAALEGLAVAGGLEIVLVNDGAYGNVRRIQATSYGNRLIASDLQNPDFATLADSFGIASFKAIDAKQLEDALHKAFALNAPALVWVPHGDVPSPWDMIMMPKVR